MIFYHRIITSLIFLSIFKIVGKQIGEIGDKLLIK